MTELVDNENLYPKFMRGNEEYQGIYNALRDQLRSDSSHIEKSVTMEVLIERICTVYTTIKYYENTRWTNGPQEQKEYNANFMNLVKEFNKVVETSQHKKLERMKDTLVEVVTSNISKHVRDASARKDLLEDIATELQNRGIK